MWTVWTSALTLSASFAAAFPFVGATADVQLCDSPQVGVIVDGKSFCLTPPDPCDPPTDVSASAGLDCVALCQDPQVGVIVAGKELCFEEPDPCDPPTGVTASSDLDCVALCQDPQVGIIVGAVNACVQPIGVGPCSDGEVGAVVGDANVCVEPGLGGEISQCDDGWDNDGDGNADMADAGCSGPNDGSEAGEITAEPCAPGEVGLPPACVPPPKPFCSLDSSSAACAAAGYALSAAGSAGSQAQFIASQAPGLLTDPGIASGISGAALEIVHGTFEHDYGSTASDEADEPTSAQVPVALQTAQALGGGSSAQRALILHGRTMMNLAGWEDFRSLLKVQYKHVEFVGYYGGECSTDDERGQYLVNNAAHHPDRPPVAGTDIHAHHYGGNNEHVLQNAGSGCPGFLNERRHWVDTKIQHLAYHVAWEIFDHHSVNGEIVDVYSYSLGGLLIRYALARVAEGHGEFPPHLLVEDVITASTPHSPPYFGVCTDGADDVQQICGWEDDFMDWLWDHAQNPQGRDGTDWTLMGSECDGFVPAFMATDMNANHKVVFEEVGPGHNDGSCWDHYSPGPFDSRYVSEEGRARCNFIDFGGDHMAWDLCWYGPKWARFAGASRNDHEWQPDACDPGATVRLYEDSGPSGGCKSFNGEDFDFANDVYDNGHAVDESVSALRIRPGFKATLYTGPDHTGSSRWYAGEVSFVNGWWTDANPDTQSWNDAFSSMKVEPIPACDAFAPVVAYESTDRFSPSPWADGWGCKSFFATDTDFADDPFHTGRPVNNRVGEVVVQAGFVATFFTNVDPPGECLRIVGPFDDWLGEWSYRFSWVWITPSAEEPPMCPWPVRTYDDPNYGGGMRAWAASDGDLSNDVFDNGETVDLQISSLRVEPGYLLTAYSETEYRGACTRLTGGWPWLGTPLQDTFRSFILSPISSPPPCDWTPFVVAYEHIDHGGGARAFYGSDADFSGDTFDNGVGLNDAISSLRVRAGYRAVLCYHAGFGNPCDNYLGEVSWVGAGNDQYSALRVEPA